MAETPLPCGTGCPAAKVKPRRELRIRIMSCNLSLCDEMQVEGIPDKSLNFLQANSQIAFGDPIKNGRFRSREAGCAPLPGNIIQMATFSVNLARQRRNEKRANATPERKTSREGAREGWQASGRDLFEHLL